MSRRIAWALACALLVSVLPLSPSAALAATTTSGQAAKIPWTGYWWPYLTTYTNKLYNNPGPMKKYDAYAAATGRTGGAYSWEYANHRTTDAANSWWGHCQAWSAAAIMEDQPPARTKAGVAFTQDDAEGLYAETWTRQVGYMYGARYRGEGTSSAAYTDVYPAVFDQQVRYWIGQQRIALMMDFDPGTAVWNYPVYAFTRTATVSGDKEYVTMTVTRAATLYASAGTSPIRKTYYYTLQSGTNGLWTNPSGTSEHDHPDYIVKVTGRATDYGNPNVKPAVLNEIFRQ
jgi:hypothetical protein